MGEDGHKQCGVLTWGRGGQTCERDCKQVSKSIIWE